MVCLDDDRLMSAAEECTSSRIVIHCRIVVVMIFMMPGAVAMMMIAVDRIVGIMVTVMSVAIAGIVSAIMIGAVIIEVSAIVPAMIAVMVSASEGRIVSAIKGCVVIVGAVMVIAAAVEHCVHRKHIGMSDRDIDLCRKIRNVRQELSEDCCRSIGDRNFLVFGLSEPVVTCRSSRNSKSECKHKERNMGKFFHRKHLKISEHTFARSAIGVRML